MNESAKVPGAGQPGLRFVLASGHAAPKSRGRDAGGQFVFLQKPYTGQRLADAVQAAMAP
jgi:hypothetical protein